MTRKSKSAPAQTRPTCRFCNSSALEDVVDLGGQPLANSYLREDQLLVMEPHYPLRVYRCGECHLVQTPAMVKAEEIFSHYLYFSSYSSSWLEHARKYVESVGERFALGPESLVVELASNDGYLLQYFVEKEVRVLGIEPARNVAEVARSRGIDTIAEFFGEELAKRLVGRGRHADCIIGNNVLAHVPNLNDFVRGMKVLLSSAGVITMEFPHLVRLVKEVQFDTIYHEHLSYYSFVCVNRVFAAHGLRIFDVEQLPTHGGSLRIYASHKDGRHAETPHVAELLKYETDRGYEGSARYTQFRDEIYRVKRDLLKFLIEAREKGKTVAGYGAPAKGNTLLNFCGVRTDLVAFTVDRSPHKQGLFLPGTHIPILAPEQIFARKPDYVLVLPWNLKDEIMKQMATIREWNGRFVTPIPRLEVS